jgi:hypothetical protein
VAEYIPTFTSEPGKLNIMLISKPRDSLHSFDIMPLLKFSIEFSQCEIIFSPKSFRPALVDSLNHILHNKEVRWESWIMYPAFTKIHVSIRAPRR